MGRGNEWIQTSNPVQRRYAGGGVEGYRPLNVTETANSWGGLEWNNDQCLLDGSVGPAWYYCVGAIQVSRAGFLEGKT